MLSAGAMGRCGSLEILADARFFASTPTQFRTSLELHLLSHYFSFLPFVVFVVKVQSVRAMPVHLLPDIGLVSERGLTTSQVGNLEPNTVIFCHHHHTHRDTPCVGP